MKPLTERSESFKIVWIPSHFTKILRFHCNFFDIFKTLFLLPIPFLLITSLCAIDKKQNTKLIYLMTSSLIIDLLLEKITLDRDEFFI